MILLFHLLVGCLDLVFLHRLAASPSAARTRLLCAQAALIALVITWGWAELIGHSLFALLRLLGLLLFVHLPAVLLVVAWRSRRARFTAGVLSLAAATLVAVAIDAYWIEPRRLEVSRVEIQTSALRRPHRIAVLADLQTDAIGSYERGVLEAIMEAEPDLILLPGDYLQISDPRRREVVGQELRQALLAVRFGARLGAFATTGDMEGGDWTAPFVGTDVTPLSQRTTLQLGELVVTLLPGRESHDPTLVVGPQPGFHIVMGHAPDFALGAVDADLLLAGHTHGGQVRLPWIGPLMTFSRVPRAWAAGVTDLGEGRTLVVSRGVGMERGQAPRLRFLCRPEIVLIDLVPETLAASAAH